jgi:hypothetical protein
MTDLLLCVAKRLGIPTETSAGPGGSPPVFSIWARWPRHPYEIAQDVLNTVLRSGADANITPVGGTPLWRARHGRWTHIGRFEDAVAHLASHVVDNPRTDTATLSTPVTTQPQSSQAGASR